MNKLNEICKIKKKNIEELKKRNDYTKIKSKKLRGFFSSLKKNDNNNFNLIAELKKASPSQGILCNKFDPVNIAEKYETAGAKCLSILTEEKFFLGNINLIPLIKEKVSIPVLRKDFIIDEWQIYESFHFEADCILLILAILNDEQIFSFYKLAKNLGMDVICEIHDEEELKRAIKLKVECIGVNNRNLKTLKVSLENFKKYSRMIPSDIIKICESGIKNNKNMRELSLFGADAFLVGESLMRSNDILKATKNLIKKK